MQTMGRRIVFVADDPDLHNLLSYTLEAEGYEVLGARTGSAALELCQGANPDLVLFDLAPSGLAVPEIRLVRTDARLRDTPIILLTDDTDEESRLQCFEVGASDVVAKPFSVRELLARIRARLPGGPVPGAASTIREEAFELDPARRQLSVEGQIVSLTRSEFRLLEGLMRQSGRVLSRSELCAAIGGTKPASEQAVDIHVRRLRRKLAPHGDRGRCIRAVRGFGYVFRPPSKLDPPS